ncbi:ankyrin repeat domain-containing protein 37 [Puma concolor]|uniref:Ankyrin repeat domain-containing protein 37 n=1 Tax=Puma concolor TaxID=9696 RepID=A0A6P6ILR2_PUMCO|nr:ankyrin repeat domain-containing protein 37 [Puma concolor]
MRGTVILDACVHSVGLTSTVCKSCPALSSRAAVWVKSLPHLPPVGSGDTSHRYSSRALDVFGEAPLHKAAKVGSLECLSLLVASDAQIDLCNKNGQTAEDLAWSCGFLECAKFLTTVKCMQSVKSSEPSDRDHCVPGLGQKRSFGSAENTTGKRKC